MTKKTDQTLSGPEIITPAQFKEMQETAHAEWLEKQKAYWAPIHAQMVKEANDKIEAEIAANPRAYYEKHLAAMRRELNAHHDLVNSLYRLLRTRAGYDRKFPADKRADVIGRVNSLLTALGDWAWH